LRSAGAFSIRGDLLGFSPQGRGRLCQKI
jgi:hypothetical protein